MEAVTVTTVGTPLSTVVTELVEIVTVVLSLSELLAQ